MPWFKVDDTFHSHPKATAASLAALGLWAVAGSWSGGHRQDGLVPDHVVRLLSRGESDLADELVAVGLWRRTRGGYRFHQWDADGDGSPRNPTAIEAKAAKAKQSSGGVIGNHRRWHVRLGITDPKCRYCQEGGRGPDPIGVPTSTKSYSQVTASGQASGQVRPEEPRPTETMPKTLSEQEKPLSGTRSVPDQRTDGIPESPPSPPVPVLKRGSYLGGEVAVGDRARKTPPRRPRCDQHADVPDDDPGPNCLGCRHARLEAELRATDDHLDDRLAIRACGLCDGDGYRLVPGRRTPITPYVRCDHQRERAPA